MTDYLKALKLDQKASHDYYNFSINNKTEQQKALEKLLINKTGFLPKNIADIACGGGGVSFHLADLYPKTNFSLIDANEDAIKIAKESTKKINATCDIGDIYNLKLESNYYELVICWQTLSWLENPENALKELIRICRPGGYIYISSLFNINYDVDIFSKVIDYTRPSSSTGVGCDCNTYSMRTVNKWVNGLVKEMKVHEFCIDIDIKQKDRSVGTYTVRTESGQRLQISAGLLMNWGILEIQK